MPVNRYTGGAQPGSYFAPQSEPQQETGDMSFSLGIDTKTVDPSLLQQGAYQRGENGRVIQGTFRTRKGMLPPGSFNQVNYGTIYGASVFYDAESTEKVCVSTAQGVWVFNWQTSATLIPLSQGQPPVSGPVHLSPAFDQLFLFRGPNQTPLYWNGQLAGGQFTTLPAPANAELSTIPNATYAVYAYNQNFVPFGKDSLAVSNYNDFTDYYTSIGQLEINSGQDDPLVSVVPWVQNSLLLFKAQSIFVLNNANQQIATIGQTGQITFNPSVSMQQISGRIGIVGQKAWAISGTQCFFVDYSGIYSISQVFETQPQQAALPMSWPMQKYFDRINWLAASGIRGATWREYVYFFVPLDESTRNNAVFVYNTQFGRWESCDFFGDPNFYADEVLIATMGGEKRVFLCDFQRGIITLWEEGSQDITSWSAGGYYWINTVFQSRGFGLSDADTRNWFKTAEIRLGGWQPEYSISIVGEGVSNTQTVCTGRTKNNTLYYTLGPAAWVPNNVNGDWSNPFRQDYSTLFDVVVNGQKGFYLGANGVILDQRQSSMERFRMRRVSNSCSVLITCSQGSIDVNSILLNAQPMQRSEKGFPG